MGKWKFLTVLNWYFCDGYDICIMDMIFTYNRYNFIFTRNRYCKLLEIFLLI